MLPDVGDDRLRPMAAVSVPDDETVVSEVTLQAHQSLFRGSLYPSCAAGEEVDGTEVPGDATKSSGESELRTRRQQLRHGREGNPSPDESQGTWGGEEALCTKTPAAAETSGDKRPKLDNGGARVHRKLNTNESQVISEWPNFISLPTSIPSGAENDIPAVSGAFWETGIIGGSNARDDEGVELGELGPSKHGESCRQLHQNGEGAHAKLNSDQSQSTSERTQSPSLPSTTPSAGEGIPTEPGAFRMMGITGVSNQRDEDGVELGEQSQIQPAVQDSELVEAYVVSDPVARATPEQHRTTNCMGRRRWAYVLLGLVVGLVPIISSFSALVFGRDPDRMEHQKIKQTIVEAFGDSYFDNPQKEKALHWIIHEDPRNGDVGVRGQGHHQTNLVQRFSLVAFYFQTTTKHPWRFCNPPVGKQSDTCYYNTLWSSAHRDTISNRWLSAADECQWMGVTCDTGTKTVTEIVIKSNNMTGSIPAKDIAMLKDLSLLWLVLNNLTGPLPKILFESKKLQSILLRANQLTGDIPPQAFLMPNLKELRLGYNQFRGSIPPEIGKFGGNSLQLSSNLLSGAIPQELYSATGLQNLLINENLLTGNLSPSIGALTALHDLAYGRNHMQGPMPSQIGLLKNLVYFDASRSGIGGTIPEELYNCQLLRHVSLSKNQISGTISTRVGLLKQLSFFEVADNHIHGILPKELGSVSRLELLDISGNGNLTGSIPDKLCSHRNQRLKIAADCTPAISTGVPAMLCPQGCCSTCCDAETKICADQ